jgi:hypothetical protein
MTAEEQKAKELIEKFMPLVESFSEQQRIENAKKCAIIAVDEMIQQFTNKCCESANVRYCKEVKTEIENYQP